MGIFEKIAVEVEAGKVNQVEALVQEAMDNDVPAEDILGKGLVGGMMSIGVKFKNNTVFIPEVLIAARAMKSGLAMLGPLLAKQKAVAEATRPPSASAVIP